MAIGRVLTQAASEWTRHKVPRLGAALAFYSALSVAPFLILLLAGASFFFDKEVARQQAADQQGGQAEGREAGRSLNAAQQQVADQMKGLLGEQGGEAIEAMLKSASKPGSGIVATIISLATLLFGASGVFGELQDSMNTVWEVAPKPGRGFFGMIADRFLSFAMVMGVAFLLLVSLVLSATLAGVSQFFAHRLPVLLPVMQAVNIVVSFSVITALFCMMFKVLPDVQITWRDTLVGGVLTALLFTLGKLAIGAYLGRAALGSAYGAAGSLVALLLWVYYSAQILFFGAEFTRAYANELGSKIRPAKDAVDMSPEALAKQGLLRPAK